MAAAVGPFIPDHAAQFAVELLGFLNSNMSVASHDRLIFGAAAEPVPVQLEATAGQLELEAGAASQSTVVPACFCWKDLLLVC